MGGTAFQPPTCSAGILPCTTNINGLDKDKNNDSCLFKVAGMVSTNGKITLPSNQLVPSSIHDFSVGS